jgi:hypothetical protein
MCLQATDSGVIYARIWSPLQWVAGVSSVAEGCADASLQHIAFNLSYERQPDAHGLLCSGWLVSRA